MQKELKRLAPSYDHVISIGEPEPEGQDSSFSLWLHTTES
jgi:hypothetical protein